MDKNVASWLDIQRGKHISTERPCRHLHNILHNPVSAFHLQSDSVTGYWQENGVQRIQYFERQPWSILLLLSDCCCWYRTGKRTTSCHNPVTYPIDFVVLM